jgi:ABC-type cobalt transport system substrate-binding protein
MLTGGSSYFENIAGSFKSVIATLLPAFIGLVIIGFAYGLFRYLKGGAEEKEQGKNIMIWGGLAVVVLLSIYGIAGLLQRITGANNNATITIPTTAGSNRNASAPTYTPSPGDIDFTP